MNKNLTQLICTIVAGVSETLKGTNNIDLQQLTLLFVTSNLKTFIERIPENKKTRETYNKIINLTFSGVIEIIYPVGANKPRVLSPWGLIAPTG